ncbi:MAG TPA: MarR family transcriptional regulator [Candidatus Melainabacteria bacterium]|jgi:DNA-binding MarR family transcriptional regulator|nr:MarR family transcriptional regulator [Candidatus Melainabacteria bacterium]HIN66903.1 MarR family transcriptional regulator [Candidatus Obscuribacterales bacterium]
MVATEPTSTICSREILESIPVVMHYIRKGIRRELGDKASVPQIRALSFIRRNPSTTLTTVSEYLAVSNATTSSIVDRLVKKGLVTRSEDPNERRCLQLTLTQKGQEEYKVVEELAISELTKVLMRLPDDQVKQIQAGLRILKEALEEERK